MADELPYATLCVVDNGPADQGIQIVVNGEPIAYVQSSGYEVRSRAGEPRVLTVFAALESCHAKAVA